MALPAAASDDVTGVWLAENGKAQIRIAPCGRERCGTIVWTKAPAKDVHNPSPELRNRDLVGVQMISGAKRDGETWSGSLYNPVDGQTYTGRMQARGGEMNVSGCVMAGLVCRSQTWTRVR